jgi:DNA-dependent RNA polymerase auxiliary subunit epsilon
MAMKTTKTIRNSFEEPKRSVPIISLSAAAFDYEKEESHFSRNE